MTLTSAAQTIYYSPSGSDIVFDVTFVFWDAADLRVVYTDADGVDTDWVNGTQYTVTGGDGATGSITISTAPTDYTPASGTKLTILSNRADAQNLSLPLGGDLPSASIEQGLDQMVRLIQQQASEVSRALLLPVSLTGVSADLPTPSASTPILQFKSDGTGFEWIDDSSGSAVAAAASAAAAAADAATAVAATTRRWVFTLVNDNETLTTGLKLTRRAPYALTVTDIKGYVIGASSSGNVTLDVHEAGTTIMATDKITVEASETHSDTATTQPAVTDTAIADQGLLEFYVDAAGTGAKGCVIEVEGTTP